MKILIAADSFKGSLDAVAACAAIGRGVRLALPDAETDLCPLADGGEGTAAVLHAVLGDGEWIEHDVGGPLPGQTVRAAYLWIEARRPLAVIDLAAASGLTLLPRERLDPLRATTYGTGELIAAALERGARRVWLALGGSATVDGGSGLAAALGWRFLDAAGLPVGPGGGDLERVARIVPPTRPLRARFTALRDVENRLLGDLGAARVFGPQKGAAAPVVERLERGLDRLSGAIEDQLGLDPRAITGGGAAGGAGAGAAVFLDARLVSGAKLVLRLSRFDARLRDADLVLTGEGRLDSQSLAGKVVSAVARAAARRGVPVGALAGRVTLDPRTAAAHGIRATEAAAEGSVSDADALAQAAPRLEAAAARLMTRLAVR